MGLRFTGFSTPIFGASWEYTQAKKQNYSLDIIPNQKIKVYISSISGSKYDKVTDQLKRTIESTELAQVHISRKKTTLTNPDKVHDSIIMEDSDVCIFLIDNADGINSDVWSDIDSAMQKYKKISIFCFCDEFSREKTIIEKSLTGNSLARTIPIHRFDDLSKNGASALVDEIISIYHYYCSGRIYLTPEDEESETQVINIADIEKNQLPTIPKTVLDSVDQCKEYILKLTTGHSWKSPFEKPNGSSDIDEWCAQFLPVLFEGTTIKQFNTGMFLDTLKGYQTKEHYQIVEARWKAIQSYFLGDVANCVEDLKTVLQLAKDTNQPSWIINDILIDLRNQDWNLCIMNSQSTDFKAQKELDSSEDKVYYPTLDRLHESMYEKYIDGLYKKKIASPYTVTYGGDFSQYGEMLASSYIVAMYNGSLTHILLIYNELKRFLFYLCSNYDNWNLRRDLYKFAIYTGDKNEIEGVQNSYPEVLNKLSSDDAAEIMNFCSHNPIIHSRVCNQLQAFGSVGYYLDDDKFKEYQELIVSEIWHWFDDKHSSVNIGYGIFKCLSGVAHRMPQDTLAEICCTFMDKHYSHWYIDMFKFWANYIDLNRMTKENARSLVDHINRVFENEEERELIQYSPAFLSVLRTQSRTLTEELDKNVSIYLPTYYAKNYTMAITENPQHDYPEFIRNYLEQIKKDNQTQGKDARFSVHAEHSIAIIRVLLSEDAVCIDAALMNDLIATVSDTLLYSKEDIGTKLDAISLLSYIAIKYQGAYNQNQEIYEKLFENEEIITSNNFDGLISNIDGLALKIGLQFLYTAIGKDRYTEILELMPYIQSDIATTISVTRQIAQYIEIQDAVVLPRSVETIVLQNVLQWLHSDNTDIRWNATKILLALCRSPENANVVNHQIIRLIDTDNVYIKNLIMRNIYTIGGIEEATRDYVVSKCSNDANYVVRMVCTKEKENNLSKNAF